MSEERGREGDTYCEGRRPLEQHAAFFEMSPCFSSSWKEQLPAEIGSTTSMSVLFVYSTNSFCNRPTALSRKSGASAFYSYLFMRVQGALSCDLCALKSKSFACRRNFKLFSIITSHWPKCYCEVLTQWAQHEKPVLFFVFTPLILAYYRELL